ncbi:MAG: biotin transporter BioY [Candidatus Latescibacteria bacterium]|nr:biotin transporter BioY [Candidatus Latescibacterota bacterium]
MQTGILSRAATKPLTRSRMAEIAVWVTAFTIATALSAQVRIPLPFTPVPITLQTFFVLLAGVVLGPGWGALSMGFYLAIGTMGLPVFSGSGAGLAHLTGATAGYLLACPPAAYLAGMLAGRDLKRSRVYPAILISGLLILAAGTAWLALLLGLNPGRAAAAGFWPFIIGDLIKTAAAAELGLVIGRRG